MLHHQTKDPLYVMNFLRHRSMKSTLKYINIKMRARKTIDEAYKLLEVGFNYFTTIEGVQIFGKRKQKA